MKNAHSHNEREICRLLSDYYLKANALAIKVSNYAMECSGAAYFATLEMPDESMFEKAFRGVVDKLTPAMRKLRVNGMMELKNEAQKLYGRYKGVFKRVNEILRERGRQSLDLRGLTFQGLDFATSYSLDNEDWGLEMNDLADKIRKYLDDSADIADRLVHIFEGSEQIMALENAEN